MNDVTNVTKTNTHEPLFRIAKRQTIPFWKSILIRLIAVILALVVDGLIIFLITKINPIDVYRVMFEGTFGTVKRMKWALRDLSTLLCIGVALAPAFKMRFWNIGAEGQILMGALATAFCMIKFGASLSAPLLLIVMFLASVIAGGIWGFIPAIFKAKFNTNETLFTLMMNYIAINLVAFSTEIWRGKNSAMPLINSLTKAGWFPNILGDDFTLNIIIAFLLAAAIYFYLKRSKQGYEIAVVGESENTARYAGINVKKVIIRTMIISGAICGICGYCLVAGKDHTISTGTAGGRGFTAIIVAWLAKFNTFTMILISFILIFLEKGSAQITSSYNTMNKYAADVIVGIILFFILGCEFFINYKIIFNKHSREVDAK